MTEAQTEVWPICANRCDIAVTIYESSDDAERRARLFKEAVEGAREDAKAMRMEDQK